MKTVWINNGSLKGSLAALFVVSSLASGAASATELLNSSYDVSRELFAALNPPFQKQWAEQNGGDKLEIKQSHAGSSVSVVKSPPVITLDASSCWRP